jgi:hypothetical protein
MKTMSIGNITVKNAVEALQYANKQKWFALFDSAAELFHNGEPKNFAKFFYPAFGFEHFNSIDKFDSENLTVFGELSSFRFGLFPAYMRFRLNEQNLIIRLEIGQFNLQ